MEVIKTNGAWGSQLDITAFCNTVHTKVTVYDPETGPTVYGEEYNEREIEIAYANNCHFDLIIPADEADNGQDEAVMDESETHKTNEGASSPSTPAAGINAALESTRQAIASLPVNETADEKHEATTLTRLLQTVFTSRASTLLWLWENQIIPSTMSCPLCGSPMRLRPQLSDRADGGWICQLNDVVIDECFVEECSKYTWPVTSLFPDAD